MGLGGVGVRVRMCVSHQSKGDLGKQECTGENLARLCFWHFFAAFFRHGRISKASCGFLLNTCVSKATSSYLRQHFHCVKNT